MTRGKEATVSGVFVTKAADVELQRFFDLNVQVDQVERRRAGAHVQLGRRNVAAVRVGVGGGNLVGVNVLEHRIGGELPHVPLGGQKRRGEELESLLNILIFAVVGGVRQADGVEDVGLAILLVVAVAAAAAVARTLARARRGGAQACETSGRGACGSRSVSCCCCCCMVLAHRYRLRRGGRRRGTLILRRSRRVTVGKFGVEVDKIGEESLSFTGDTGGLDFDEVLRQRDLGTGRERRRLLWCRNADLASKGVTLVDNAAAVDIDVASDLSDGGTLLASDTLKLCEGIRCWEFCSSSAS